MVNRTTPKKNTSKKGIQKRKQNSTMKQATRVGGAASRRHNPEKKFVDVNAALVVPVASQAFSPGVLINGLATGSSASQRIGRQVNLKALLMKGWVSLASTSVGGSPIRILAVYDKQANGVAPVITDILLADSFTSPNNLSNRDRFVTIFDNYTEIISTGNNFSAAVNLFKQFDLEEMFNAGTAGDITDITSGSIYVFAAQNSNITTAAPTVSMRYRVRYTDV